jgi:outer membrane receptor protein involved in Fe transport
VKTSVQITRYLAFNGGLTQVVNALFLGTPRVYVDSAPHSVANSALTVTEWHGFNGSLRYRHVSNTSGRVRPHRSEAAGLDVIDLSTSRQIRHGLDFNFAIDNLSDKRHYETQNWLESRVTPTADAKFRAHGTPGFPFGFTVGLTLRLFGN